MEITKKQMGTLRKIMRREEKAYDPQKMFCRPGIHPCGLGCLITDGQVSVILNRSPENLPAGGRMDSLARAVSRECGSGSYYLLEAATLEGDPGVCGMPWRLRAAAPGFAWGSRLGPPLRPPCWWSRARRAGREASSSSALPPSNSHMGRRVLYTRMGFAGPPAVTGRSDSHGRTSI